MQLPMRLMRCVLVVVLVCWLVGCSTLQKTDPDQPVQLQLWHYYIGEQKKAFDLLVDEFNLSKGRERGIIIESISKANINALSTQIIEAVNHNPGAEPLPDLFFTYADLAYILAQQDLLVDYTQYVEHSVLSEYHPGFLQEGRLYGDDRLYILPAAKCTEILIVNQTRFEEFADAYNATGPSAPIALDQFATWEGIVQASKAYYEWTSKHRSSLTGGKALFGIDSLSNYLYSGHKQLGVDFVSCQNEKGVVDFSSDALSRIWETYYLSTIRGYFASFGRFRSDDLKTGDILAFLGSNVSAAYLSGEVMEDNGKTTPIQLEVLPMPVFEGGTPVAIQQGAGIAAICTDVRREAAATAFVTWFSEPERNIAFASQSAYLPVRNQAIQTMLSDLIQKNDTDPLSKALRVSLEQINSGYEMYTPTIFQDSYAVRQVLGSVLHDKTKQGLHAIEEACQDGEDEERIRTELSGDGPLQSYINDCCDKLSGLEITLKR